MRPSCRVRRRGRRHHRAAPAAGTSKWNKIEHRLFSAITMNWRPAADLPRSLETSRSPPNPYRHSRPTTLPTQPTHTSPAPHPHHTTTPPPPPHTPHQEIICARSDHPFGANGAGPGRDQDCGFAAFRPSDGAPVDVAPSGVRVVEQDDDGMVGFFVVLWRAGRVSHQGMRPTRRIGIGKAGPRWPPRSRQGRQPPAGGHDRPLRYLPSWSCRFHSRRPLSSLRRKSERRLAAVRDRTKAARRSYPSGR